MNFLFYLTFISFFVSTKQQVNLMDTQYRQADVPPVVAVMFDVPSYSKNDLYKWENYITANKELIRKNEEEDKKVLEKIYDDRMTRLGKLKLKYGV